MAVGGGISKEQAKEILNSENDILILGKIKE